MSTSTEPSVTKEVNRAIDRGVESVATPFRACGPVLEINFPRANIVRDVPHGMSVRPHGCFVIMEVPGQVRTIRPTDWNEELAFLAATKHNTRALVVFYTVDPPLDRTRDVGPPTDMPEEDCCICVTIELTQSEIQALGTGAEFDLVAPPDAGFILIPLHGVITTCLAAGGYGNISDPSWLSVMYTDGAKAYNFIPNNSSISTGSATRLSDLLGATEPEDPTNKVARLTSYVDTEGVMYGNVPELQDAADLEGKGFVLKVNNNSAGAFTGGDPGDVIRITLCYRVEELPPCGGTPEVTPLCAEAAQASSPTAANGVALTPNSTAWASSAWVPIFTTSGSVALSAIAWNQPDMGWQSFLAEWDIATGAPGAEVVIATVPFNCGFSLFTGMNEVSVPLACGPIPTGTPISVRLRKEGTSVLGWTVSLNYYNSVPLPLQTLTPPIAVPLLSGASVTPHGTAWNNSGWVEISAAIASAWTIGGAVFREGNSGSANQFGELDIGTGAAGAEVVKTTLRFDHGGNFWGMGPNVVPCWPLSATLPAGSRVAIRMRKSGPTTTPWNWRLLVYPALSDADAVTALPQQCWPPAADALALTPNASAWVSGAWVEFKTTTAFETAIVGFTASGASVDSEIDIGTGAAGFEVVKSTTRLGAEAADVGGEGAYAFGLALVLPASVRVACRMRSRNGFGRAISLVVIESPDFTFKTAEPEAVWPPAANALAVYGSGVVWTSGAWTEAVASAPAGAVVTGLTFTPQTAGIDAEIDIGVGLAGFEVTKTTIRVFGEDNATSHSARRKLLVPLCLEGGDRVALRLRQNGTITTPWEISLTYVPNISNL